MPITAAITLPPVLLHWPWELRTNPHHETVKQQSDDWFESFHAFEPVELKAFIDCDFALFASMIYSFVNEDHLRIGHDLMNLFFLFDEYTDIRNGSETCELRDIVMDALHHPDTRHPEPYSVVGRFTQQFWARATQTASKTCQRVFLSTFEAYVTSVIRESTDRVDGVVLDVDNFMAHRRDTAGSFPTYAMLLLDMEIPAYALEHPLIDRLTVLAGDMIIHLNDMYSYCRELERGLASHNLITVVMRQYDIDLNSAFKWVADRQVATEREFLLLRSQLPKWDNEEVNINIERYVDGLGYAVRGLEDWSFASSRYFGSRGLEIQKSRIVQLGVKDEWNWEVQAKL